MESRIFLTGFMGSGKSTLGKALAHDLGYIFIDLDHVIEHENKMPITEIFNRFGEHGFREKEAIALHTLAERQDIVVATGGGAPCFFDNMEWMNRKGMTIFLDCSIDILMNRLKSEQDHRPLLKGFDEEGLRLFIEKKLNERRPFYEKAKLQVLVDDNIKKMVEWIIQSMKED